MNALIIDDETRARSLLKNIINQSSFEFDGVLEAPTLLEGIELIKKHQIDIVFLDVEMPHHRGTEIFDFLDIEEFSFALIFTTAYSDYALKAFELNAVDYILKPLRPSKIEESIQKVIDQNQKDGVTQKLEELKSALNSSQFNKIGLPLSDGIVFVEIEEIIHLEADGMYTNVFTENNGKILISKPLKHFVNLLEDKELFYRPHRSHVVNLKYMKQYVKKSGNYIVLSNENIVPVSRDKREEFTSILTVIG